MNIEGVELPDPLELIVKGREDHVIGYACPACGCAMLVHKRSDPKLYEADRLHKQQEAAQHCQKLCPCGQVLAAYRLRCRACLDHLEQEKEQARFEKSEKLTIEQYDGPVYWDGHSGNIGDGYFSDIDALLDHCEQEGLDVPEYVWSCEPKEMKLSAEDIIERAVEEMYEDAYDSISEKSKIHLQLFLDTWCKEQNIVSWHDDRSRSVLLREPMVSSAPPPAEPADLAG
jgi:hypothetical protein